MSDSTTDRFDFNVKKLERVSIQLPEEVYADMLRIARNRGVTLSTVASKMAEVGLEEYRKRTGG